MCIPPGKILGTPLLVTLIYLYTDAGHPYPYVTDVLNVSAGPHTTSQGDPGDPDIRYTHLLMIPTDLIHVLAGPHTPSQGDAGDPDPAVWCGAGHHLCPLGHTGQGPGGHHSALQ
jgi:hypothetical protein